MYNKVEFNTKVRRTRTIILLIEKSVSARIELVVKGKSGYLSDDYFRVRTYLR